MTDESTANHQGDDSVQDILQNLGAEQADLLVGYQDRLGALAEERSLPPGEYLKDLPEEVKAQKLLTKKIEAASEAREKTKARYTEVTRTAHEQLDKRRESVREELFSVAPELLTQVALAEDGKLEILAQAAIRAGSSGLPLAKAVLSEAHARGLGEVVTPLLATFSHLEGPLREWQSLPPKEVLNRQLDPGRIENVIPAVDAERLKARPRVSPY